MRGTNSKNKQKGPKITFLVGGRDGGWYNGPGKSRPPTDTFRPPTKCKYPITNFLAEFGGELRD